MHIKIVMVGVKLFNWGGVVRGAKSIVNNLWENPRIPDLRHHQTVPNTYTATIL